MYTKTYQTIKYIVAHNGNNIIHPSIVESNSHLYTAQPYLEEFDTEEEWKTRLGVMGYNIDDL